MNPLMLFMTQLLPLIVFIVVDSLVEDVRISILCAILFAGGQLLHTYVKSHRFEWMVLIDVGLIIGLGVVSIVLKNEIFFKVKPAVVEGVAILFFIGLVLAPDEFLLRYFGRMMPGMSVNPEILKYMKSMLVIMGVCTIIHIGAVLYTAFYSSREIWVFVSGPGFYIMMVPIMVVMIFFKRRNAYKRQ